MTAMQSLRALPLVLTLSVTLILAMCGCARGNDAGAMRTASAASASPIESPVMPATRSVLPHSSVTPTATTKAAASPWRVFAGDRSAPGVFNEVTAVAVDSQGNMYVGDKWNGRVQKLAPDGKPLAQWGTRGTGRGQFINIISIALDLAGNIYVLDARLTTDSRHVDGEGNNRIQKLSPEGVPLAEWGSEGRKPGQFFAPGCIAVDHQGSIYVADTGNNRVQKLSPDGEPLVEWGAQGAARIERPVGIGVDSHDNVYVVSGFGRIVKISPEGNQLKELASNDQQLWSSIVRAAVAVDEDGNIFTLRVADNGADGANNRIRVFSPSGKLLAEWGSTGGFPGQFHYAHDLALDGEGNVYVANTQDDCVAKLSPTGEPLTQFGAPARLAGGAFNCPNGLAADDQGNIWVADWGNQRVQKLSATGAPIEVWGGLGQGVGQIGRPDGIVVDGQGNVYMTDGYSRVQKLSPTGQLLWGLGSGKTGSGAGDFMYPGGIALDGDGNVYVADSGNDRIQKLTADGQPLAQWGTGGNKPGQFGTMRGIAVDKAGHIYVADTGHRCVHKFTLDGQLLQEFGVTYPGGTKVDAPIPSSASTRLVSWGAREPFLWEYPDGVAVDENGNVYVSDRTNDTVVQLSPEGELIGRWGGTGIGPGQFHVPTGVAVDRQGNLFVAEWTNKRIQVLPE